MFHTGRDETTIESTTPARRIPATTTAEPNRMRKRASTRMPPPNPNRFSLVIDIA
jgi:hypothetical protein